MFLIPWETAIVFIRNSRLCCQKNTAFIPESSMCILKQGICYMQDVPPFLSSARWWGDVWDWGVWTLILQNSHSAMAENEWLKNWINVMDNSDIYIF